MNDCVCVGHSPGVEGVPARSDVQAQGAAGGLGSVGALPAAARPCSAPRGAGAFLLRL